MLQHINAECLHINHDPLSEEDIAHIDLTGRTVFLDTAVFGSLIRADSTTIRFDHNPCVKALRSDELRPDQPAVHALVPLDLADADHIIVLSDTLVDHAVGQCLAEDSLDINDLPLGMKVQVYDLACLNAEVRMRTAVLQQICGATRAGTKKEQTAAAASHNAAIRLHSQAYVAGAIVVTNDSTFCSTFATTLKAAGFGQLEYLTVKLDDPLTPLSSIPDSPGSVISYPPTAAKSMRRSKLQSLLRRKPKAAYNTRFMMLNAEETSEMKDTTYKPIMYDLEHGFLIPRLTNMIEHFDELDNWPLAKQEISPTDSVGLAVGSLYRSYASSEKV